ncbi:HK97 gp10 family phage protein [Sphingomonas sp.]|uniref:HK97 gp10 family phage protein n=1 Tax=Sphingomonas sp. TaxID=28214 RepID=UPI003BA9DF3C
MKGRKAHIARLKKLTSPATLMLVEGALFAGGQKIQVEAQISITTGAVSGKNHVPSKPGEPPNADTHQLADGIITRRVRALTVEVASTAPHARIEWDWGNVAARPYMRPARDKMKGEIVRDVEKALSVAVRRSRSTGAG